MEMSKFENTLLIFCKKMTESIFINDKVLEECGLKNYSNLELNLLLSFLEKKFSSEELVEKDIIEALKYEILLLLEKSN